MLFLINLEYHISLKENKKRVLLFLNMCVRSCYSYYLTVSLVSSEIQNISTLLPSSALSCREICLQLNVALVHHRILNFFFLFYLILISFILFYLFSYFYFIYLCYFVDFLFHFILCIFSVTYFFYSYL